MGSSDFWQGAVLGGLGTLSNEYERMNKEEALIRSEGRALDRTLAAEERREAAQKRRDIWTADRKRNAENTAASMQYVEDESFRASQEERFGRKFATRKEAEDYATKMSSAEIETAKKLEQMELGLLDRGGEKVKGLEAGQVKTGIEEIVASSNGMSTTDLRKNRAAVSQWKSQLPKGMQDFPTLVQGGSMRKLNDKQRAQVEATRDQYRLGLISMEMERSLPQYQSQAKNAPVDGGFVESAANEIQGRVDDALSYTSDSISKLQENPQLLSTMVESQGGGKDGYNKVLQIVKAQINERVGGAAASFVYRDMKTVLDELWSLQNGG